MNNKNVLNNEIHSYECDKDRSVPFYGSGYDFINNEKIKVSSFVYDNQENCLINTKKYLNELGLNYNNNIRTIFKKYKSDFMCIWNKKEDYFIQWLNISIDDFVMFLDEFKYETNFIDHIKSNRNNYKNLSHEITIVFDKTTLNPIRTGFYGCL